MVAKRLSCSAYKEIVNFILVGIHQKIVMEVSIDRVIIVLDEFITY